MADLGTKDNPLVFRVTNEYRFEEMASICHENNWEFIGGLVNTEPKTGRNDPCICGSGRKYKKCCLNK